MRVILYPRFRGGRSPRALSCPWIARHVQTQPAVGPSDPLLPSPGQRRRADPHRRGIPGLQRRPPRRGLPHLLRQDAGPGARHDHRADHRRGDDPGRAGRRGDRAARARPGRFRHQHRREPLPRPALRPELHAASRLAVRRRPRALRAGRHPHLRRPLPGPGAARHRHLRARVHRPLGARRAGLHRRAALRPRRGSAEAAPGLRGVLGRGGGVAGRRADLHVVARRQLDRHEHRLSRADERRRPDGRPEQGRQRDLRDHPGRAEERRGDPRRRLAQELLPAGAADALGGLRHSQGRQRLLHPDHDRPGGVGRAVRGDARRGGELGQGEPGRAARHRAWPTAIRPSRFRCSPSTPWGMPTAGGR